MHLAFLTPTHDQPGGGSAFNDGIIPALRSLGHGVGRSDALPPPPALPIIDGLLLPDLEPQLDELLARDSVAIIHHLSAKAGRDPQARDAVRGIERRVLPQLRRVIVTSAPVQERLQAEFGVAAHLLPPGLPDLPRTMPSDEGPCRILSLGVLTPRKGQDRLLRALARLTDLDWTLVIAGDATRDPVHAAAVAALIDDLVLQSRVTLLRDPPRDAVDALWREADLFALASSWEGHPASLAEALRRGIPVVALATGGIPALIPPQAGLLCPADDPPQLGKVLRRAIFDRALRASLADGAWTAGTSLPSWPQQALALDAILRS